MRARNRAKRGILKAGLPEDVLTGSARVTLFGRGTALVEGQYGVIEMGVACIRLRTRSGILSIGGSGLVLKELSRDAAMISAEQLDTLTYGRLACEADH